MPSRARRTHKAREDLLARLLALDEQDSVLEQALPQDESWANIQDAQAAQALLDSLLEEAEAQGPQAEAQGPQAEPQGPQAEAQGPQAEPQGPQAEPQGPQEEVRFASKFKDHRSKRGEPSKMQRSKIRRRIKKQLERCKEEEREEQAMQQAEPSILALSEFLGRGRANRPSPALERVPFPELIPWHPLRGPRQIWIPWPRRLAPNNDVYNEHFEMACFLRKYGAGCKPKRAVRANRFWHCDPQHQWGYTFCGYRFPVT